MTSIVKKIMTVINIIMHINNADSLAPRLESFSVNMTSGQLLLVFDEPVNPNSVDITGVTIRGSATATDSSLYYTLTDTSRFYVEDDNNIRINLSDTDLDALRLRSQVATNELNTYISIGRGTVTDQATPPNRAQEISNARVTEFTEDVVAPQVVNFTLNLDTNSMTLIFSEPVVLSSFAPTLLTISSEVSLSPEVISYNLTGGRIHSTHQVTASRSVSFFLAQADIIYLKTTQGIATDRSNAYLSALAGLAQDTNLNPSTSLLPISASSFMRDNSAAQVVSFDLDMDRGLLTVYFNDVINAASFNGSAITLQNAPTRVPMESYTIRNVTLLSTDSGFTVTVQFSMTDVNGIKLIRSLCVSASSCFMTTAALLAVDVYSVPTTSIPNGHAVVVTQFTSDVTPPQIFSWELNMDEGQIYMTFDEPVDFTTFSPGGVTLQSGLTAADDHYQALSLTGHAALLPPGVNAGTVLVIQMRQGDIDFIKASINLGTNQNNSYLSITESTITDVSGNPVVPVLALLVTSFTPDITSPSLLWFSFNAYTGVLSLKFDEVVNVLTFNALGLTFVNRESVPPQAYNLTGGSFVGINSTLMHLNMRDSDLNSMREIGLGVSFNTTYLSATRSTIQDMNDNPLNPISVDSPLQVLYYTNSPILVSFEFPTYIFNEGQTAMLRVILNATATPDVSFMATTEDDQAIGRCHIIAQS